MPVTLHAHDRAADVHLMIDDVAEEKTLYEAPPQDVACRRVIAAPQLNGFWPYGNRDSVVGSVETFTQPGVDRLRTDADAPFAVTALDQGARQLVHQPHEVGDEQIGGAQVDLARCADLLHGALVEDDNAI